MVDAYMQALIDAPLDTAKRANGIWLPEGRRAGPRAGKPEYYGDDMPALSKSELQARRDAAHDKKLSDILTYYAGTTIPFERIAEHTKLDIEKVKRAMRARGREQ